METKRILAINPVRSVLMDGVENILGSEEKGEFELISTPANNLGDLIQEIEQLKPNVIIMEEISSFIDAVDLITSVPDNQNIRLVVLNNRYSKMDIMRKAYGLFPSLNISLKPLNIEHHDDQNRR